MENVLDQLSARKLAETVLQWFQAHAPASTATAVGPPESVAPFHPAEEAAVARAVHVRRDEFHTGRKLARTALKQLGCCPAPIPVDSDRVPVWPPGYLGSISHTRNLCIAHMGHVHEMAAIGIDVEPNACLPDNLAQVICRPDELQARPEVDALVRFVAKEAFYKAYFFAVREPLEFQEISVEIDNSSGAFCAAIVAADKPAFSGRRSFPGRYAALAGNIVAAVWITP